MYVRGHEGEGWQREHPSIIHPPIHTRVLAGWLLLDGKLAGYPPTSVPIPRYLPTYLFYRSVGAKRQQQRPAPSAQQSSNPSTSPPVHQSTTQPASIPSIEHRPWPLPLASAGVPIGTGRLNGLQPLTRRGEIPGPARTDIAIARGSPAASGALPAPVQSKIGTDSRLHGLTPSLAMAHEMLCCCLRPRGPFSR